MFAETTEHQVGRYCLSDEQEELRRTIRDLVAARIAPRAAEIDSDDEYPADIRDLFAGHDVFALAFPEEYGGTGTGELVFNIAIEEVAKASGSCSMLLAGQKLGAEPVRLAGSDAQKEHWLSKCAGGEAVPAFALSEPEAGSDPRALRSTAVRDGDEWVLNGTKNWCSNAGVADFYAVFAATDPEQHRLTAFLVERDRPGLSVTRLEHKLGMHGIPTGQLAFDNVRVPDGNRLGAPGSGLSVALATLERTRLGVAAQGVGIAQGATDYALAYAKQRITFGKPIAEHQAIQLKLAEMETRTAAARELLYRAASIADAGGGDVAKYGSMAKLFASDTAMWVTVEAVQVLGGYGYVSDYPVERMMRDAKVLQIYEGTNEIQRLVVARAMIAEERA